MEAIYKITYLKFLIMFSGIIYQAQVYSQNVFYDSYNKLTLEGINKLEDTTDVEFMVETKDTDSTKTIIEYGYDTYLNKRIIIDTFIYHKYAKEIYFRQSEHIINIHFLNIQKAIKIRKFNPNFKERKTGDDINKFCRDFVHTNDTVESILEVSLYEQDFITSYSFECYTNTQLFMLNETLIIPSVACRYISVVRTKNNIYNSKFLTFSSETGYPIVSSHEFDKYYYIDKNNLDKNLHDRRYDYHLNPDKLKQLKHKKVKNKEEFDFKADKLTAIDISRVKNLLSQWCANCFIEPIIHLEKKSNTR